MDTGERVELGTRIGDALFSDIDVNDSMAMMELEIEDQQVEQDESLWMTDSDLILIVELTEVFAERDTKRGFDEEPPMRAFGLFNLIVGRAFSEDAKRDMFQQIRSVYENLTGGPETEEGKARQATDKEARKWLPGLELLKKGKQYCQIAHQGAKHPEIIHDIEHGALQTSRATYIATYCPQSIKTKKNANMILLVWGIVGIELADDPFHDK